MLGEEEADAWRDGGRAGGRQAQSGGIYLLEKTFQTTLQERLELK